ncbi:interferon lambda receptor 1 [Ctenodactylus gundi]
MYGAGGTAQAAAGPSSEDRDGENRRHVLGLCGQLRGECQWRLLLDTTSPALLVLERLETEGPEKLALVPTCSGQRPGVTLLTPTSHLPVDLSVSHACGCGHGHLTSLSVPTGGDGAPLLATPTEPSASRDPAGPNEGHVGAAGAPGSHVGTARARLGAATLTLSPVHPGARLPPLLSSPPHLPAPLRRAGGRAAGVGGDPGDSGWAAMARAGWWAALLVCLLRAAPGRTHLAHPQNVTLISQNFSVYLTWLPGHGSPQNVTYFVAYQGSFPPRRWQRVERCSGTSALVCSLMCLKKQDLYNKFRGRVQAASAGARSRWVESNDLDYLFEVEPAPPTLVFTRTEKILNVSAIYQLPPCVPPMDLKYEVEFWKEGAGNKVGSPCLPPRTRFAATAYSQPVKVPLQPLARGYHCLRARTVYTLTFPKYSDFSEPSCFSLGTRGTNWTILVLPPILVLLAVLVAGSVTWKSLKGNPWFQQAKMPLALDFTGYRYAKVTFQPGGPESVDDLFLCPPKELTRRIRLAPPDRALAATILASSKDSVVHNDEEYMDNSVSGQPYLGQPPFPGQELQVSGDSEGDESGVDLGEPWTPMGHSEDSGAWDSSAGSCPSSTHSSPWNEAGSSGCLSKKGPSQVLDVDQRQWPVSHPDSSQDGSSLEKSLQDSFSTWASRTSSSPRWNLVAGEPPVPLQSLTFCWDSSPEEEEEGEEDDRESEPEDSSSHSWGAGSLLKTEVRCGMQGHYMARGGMAGRVELPHQPALEN